AHGGYYRKKAKPKERHHGAGHDAYITAVATSLVDFRQESSRDLRLRRINRRRTVGALLNRSVDGLLALRTQQYLHLSVTTRDAHVRHSRRPLVWSITRRSINHNDSKMTE